MATGVVYRPPVSDFPYVAVIFVEGEIVGTEPAPTLEAAEHWLQVALRSLAEQSGREGGT